MSTELEGTYFRNLTERFSANGGQFMVIHDPVKVKDYKMKFSTFLTLVNAASGDKEVFLVEDVINTGNNYTGDNSFLTSYSQDSVIVFTPSATNTGTSNLNIQSIGNLPIKKFNGTSIVDVVAGDLNVNNTYVLLPKDTYFLIVSGANTGTTSIAGFIQAGTNVVITGAGTIVSPYIISSSGGGGGGSSSFITLLDVPNSYTGAANKLVRVNNAANGLEFFTAPYLTSISSSDVTSALGYTPYNATNPNGYITASSASALTNKTGNISQWTNDSAYITASALTGYEILSNKVTDFTTKNNTKYPSTLAVDNGFVRLTGDNRISGDLLSTSSTFTVGKVTGGQSIYQSALANLFASVGTKQASVITTVASIPTTILNATDSTTPSSTRNFNVVSAAPFSLEGDIVIYNASRLTELASNAQGLTSREYVDSKLVGKAISSILATPTVTQNNYAITWDNTSSNFTLSAITGGGGTVTAVSIASANGFAGSSTGGATPALTLSTTITGLLKGNGTAISAAVSADVVTLIPDATSLVKGLLTTPDYVSFSAKYDASTGVKKTLGSIFDLTLVAASSTFYTNTVTSSTISFGASGLSLSGIDVTNPVNYTEYSGYYTNVGYWTKKITVNPTADGGGVGIGLKAVNGDHIGKMIMTGANKGKLVIETYRSGTLTNRVTTTTALSYTNTTDSIELTFTSNMMNYRITASVVDGSGNYTGTPLSIEWVDTLVDGSVSSKWLVGRSAIFHYGGSQLVKKDRYIVDEFAQNEVAIFGDSKAAGAYAGGADAMFVNLLKQSIAGGVSFVCGGGNATSGLVNITTEFTNLKPRVAIIAVAINDIIAATPTATIVANIEAFAKPLVKNGSTVFVEIPSYVTTGYSGFSTINTAVDNLATALLALTYIKTIDVRTALASAGSLNTTYAAADGLHHNATGNRIVAATYITALSSYVNITKTGSSTSITQFGNNTQIDQNGLTIVSVGNASTGASASAQYRWSGSSVSGSIGTYTAASAVNASRLVVGNLTGNGLTLLALTGDIQFQVQGQTTADVKASLTQTGIFTVQNGTASTLIIANSNSAANSAGVRATNNLGTSTQIVTSGSTNTGNFGVADIGIVTTTSTAMYIGSQTGSSKVHIYAGGVASSDVKMTVMSSGNVGIGQTTPTARLHLLAGTATAGTAPEKYTAGTLLTTIEALTQEASASSRYQSTVALNRYAMGGKIYGTTTDVSNTSTTETDLVTYTTKASTLAATDESLVFDLAGTFNDITATCQLRFYFAGTLIGDTGLLTVSATGGWSARIIVIRSGASTAKATLTVTTPTASTATYTNTSSLTSLTFTNTNIIKCTGTAAGASGGTGDITLSAATLMWWGASSN